MKKKVSMCIVALATLLSLTACESSNQNGAKEEQQSQENSNTHKKSSSSISEEKPGDVFELENGKEMTLVGVSNKEASASSGPIKVKIKKVRASITSDKQSYIEVQLETENTSDKTVEFFANQAVLTTNTGEQIDRASREYSDKVGGTFNGSVKKEGSLFFFPKDKVENIDWVKLFIKGACDENVDPIGEKIEVKINLQK
ncbi:hypothetical protein ACN6MS_01365 [Bacillus licheniformis]